MLTLEKVGGDKRIRLPKWAKIRVTLYTDSDVDQRLVYRSSLDDCYAVLSHYRNGCPADYTDYVINKDIKWYLDVLEAKDTRKGVGSRLLARILQDVKEPIYLATRGGSESFFFAKGAMYISGCEGIHSDCSMALNVDPDELYKYFSDYLGSDLMSDCVVTNFGNCRAMCKECKNYHFADAPDECV